MRRLVVLVLLLSVNPGCGGRMHMPRVAHVPVQQGNVITQEMIDKIKPGMTRKQVAFIMGEPVLRNTFNANRWDYVHSYQIGEMSFQQIHESLFFNDDVLVSFSGDAVQTDTADTPAVAPAATNDSEFDSPENNPVINEDPDG